jgi:hypothetical protein
LGPVFLTGSELVQTNPKARIIRMAKTKRTTDAIQSQVGTVSVRMAPSP